MKDENKEKAELIAELTELRKKVEMLEQKISNENSKSDNYSHPDLYKILVESAFDAIYLIRDRHYEFVNKRFCEITGYNFDELTSLDFDIEILMTKESINFMNSRYVARTNNIPISNQYELQIVNKTGEIIEIEVNTSVVENENQLLVLGIMRDVTERKTATNALKQTEKKFREMVESINEVVFEIDKDGYIIYISPAVESMFCRKPSFFLHRRVSELVIEDDVARLENDLINSKNIERFKTYYRVNALNSNVKYIQISSNPIFDNNIFTGYRGVISDISLQKEAEEKIIKSESLYKSLVDNVDIGVKVIDINYNTIMSNAFNERIFDIKSDEVIGQSCFKSFINQNSICDFCPGIKCLETGKPSEINSTLIKKDGSQMSLAIKAFPLFAIDGTKTGFIELIQDVTEIKKSQDALIKSEEKYRNVFNLCSEGMLLLDKNGYIINKNNRIREWLGYNINDNLGVNLLEFEFVTPESLVVIENKLNLLLSGADIKPVEFEMIAADGKKQIGYAVTSIIKNDIGEVTSILVMISNITERKMLEEEMRQSKIFLQTMIDNIPIMFFAKNAKTGKYVLWNKENERIMGISMENVIDKTAFDIQTLEQANVSNNSDIEALEKRSVIELPQETLDSPIFGRRYLNTKKVPIFDDNGEPLYVLGISIDITERKKIIESLRKSEAKFRNIVEHSIDGIVLSDENSNIIEWNIGMEHLTGFKKVDTIGKKSYDIYFQIYFSDQPTIENYNFLKNLETNCHKTGEIPPEYRMNDYKIIRKMKKIKDVQELIFPIRTNKGFMLASIARDVTIRKDMEYELLKSKEDLENRVFERTEQLEKIMNDLQSEIDIRKNAEDKLIQAKEEITRAFYHEKELNDMKTRFVSTISHEYRTPLTIINTSTYLLDTFFKTNNEEQFKMRINVIQNAVKQMVLLLEDVLLYGKIEADKMDVSFDYFEIIKICEKQIQETQTMDKIHHFFEFIFPNKKLIIQSNDILLKRIIANLLSNAAKYSPENTTILIELTELSDEYKIKIKDNGIGIAQDELIKIFEPFYRGKNAVYTTGTGLGLAIIKGCVESILGEISVSSEINQGTTFTLVLPKKAIQD